MLSTLRRGVGAVPQGAAGRGALQEQRRCRSQSRSHVVADPGHRTWHNDCNKDYRWPTRNLAFRRFPFFKMVRKVLSGPPHARPAMNFHSAVNRNRVAHQTGVPTQQEMVWHYARPDLDTPFGDKFFSLRQRDPDEFFPRTDNPYADGRDFRMGRHTLVADLTPHLLEEVDDRVPAEPITSGVAAAAGLARTAGELAQRCGSEWGFSDRLDAVSGRLVGHHLRLLCHVLCSQHDLREQRRKHTEEHGILRTYDGDRFFAIADSWQCHECPRPAAAAAAAGG
eukprot:TRINITY_DN13442_c0_g1_i1.p1 TRINITY_DN13442_c0_g1~~TRINITY_DN13442_c0_g1_i1.p1  ORF type:complete len:311 (+),score=104.75 TRINITY_DN13442_c0_g1_i1:91-933(+)